MIFEVMFNFVFQVIEPRAAAFYTKRDVNLEDLLGPKGFMAVTASTSLLSNTRIIGHGVPLATSVVPSAVRPSTAMSLPSLLVKPPSLFVGGFVGVVVTPPTVAPTGTVVGGVTPPTGVAPVPT